jgi:hypothetical protein
LRSTVSFRLLSHEALSPLGPNLSPA